MAHLPWVVEAAFTTPDFLTEDYLVRLDELADERDWQVTPLGRRPGVLVSAYLDTDDPVGQLTELIRDVQGWLDHHGVQTTFAGGRVLTEDQLQAEAWAPSIPELAGAADVAELLEVSRQRVHQLAGEHPQFPAPIARIAAGPIWAVPAIEHFAKVWTRRPGRPAKAG